MCQISRRSEHAFAFIAIFASVRKDEEKKNEEKKKRNFGRSYLGNDLSDFLQIWNVDSPRWRATLQQIWFQSDKLSPRYKSVKMTFSFFLSIYSWNCFNDVTQAFTYMALHPLSTIDIDSPHFKLLEHFTVIMYDKTSELQCVNEARKDLFCHKGRMMEKLPPTQDALLQHTKRVAYQAAIWCTSEQSEQQIPSPEGWGWTLDECNVWIPVWSTLPIAAKACSELVKCKCKSQAGCCGRCSCRKAGCKCTELCNCHCLD